MDTQQQPKERSLLLAIDAGNTNITFGLFQGDVIIHQWRIKSDSTKTSDQYGIEIEQIMRHFHYTREMICAVILSSVVPELVHQMSAMSERFLKLTPMIVGEGTKTGLLLRVDNPREVGADRIADAVAGYELYGGPLVIIDIGTAITHEVVNERGEYIGGTISPGIGISAAALTRGTSKLPRVELTHPDKIIATNTVNAMQAGLVRGFIGLIDGITEGILEELKMQTDKKPLVVATGGFSTLLSKHSKYVDTVNKDLNLLGLRLIYLRTVKAKALENARDVHHEGKQHA